MKNQFTAEQARKWWIQGQRLNEIEPFGRGLKATQLAVEHLGQIQIDTINVIERCHHHILFTRIPDYEKFHLYQSLTSTKTVFEYWTHVLSYLPAKDYRYYLPKMVKARKTPRPWFRSVTKADEDKVMKLIKKLGPISIRDIKDDKLQTKKHPWGSRKPSDRALLKGVYTGTLTVSERLGMIKKYDLTGRHFGWKKAPKPATEKEVLEYKLERALRTQGVVSLDSVCYLDASGKAPMKKLIDAEVKAGRLMELNFKGDLKNAYWVTPETFESEVEINDEIMRFMSPFDPMIVPRKRLQQFFDYEHKFEAYMPESKRQFGCFGLPVLQGDRFIAVIDLKTNRTLGQLEVRKMTWLGKNATAKNKRKVEEELHRFGKFQLEIPYGEEDVE